MLTLSLNGLATGVAAVLVASGLSTKASWSFKIRVFFLVSSNTFFIATLKVSPRSILADRPTLSFSDEFLQVLYWSVLRFLDELVIQNILI